GRIVGDEELKHKLASRQPYGQWLKDNKVALDDLPEPASPDGAASSQGAGANGAGRSSLLQQKQTFGDTLEELRMLTAPMALHGAEAVGSMGNDTPLAVLSDQNQLLFNYFKQLFAQVTNPPLDAIREELVTSLQSFIGRDQNLFEETAMHCHQLQLSSPIISDVDLRKIREVNVGEVRSITLSTLFDAPGGPGSPGSMKPALDQLRTEASQAIRDGYSIIILSDQGVDRNQAPIPSL
ncbi:MAG: glutamate synthase central domain-containing protein, partial [SAR202 cluster bacterium]|nr:glutamate synthase central domain-containing protein [SAR202 cluster bacterium]